MGIATTCLAETIGDDVPQIFRSSGREPEAKDVTIFNVSTPSYAASHEAGYRAALKAVVQSLAKRSEPNGRINLLLGSIVSPADVRYLKRLLGDWGQGYILLPDISETFDAPSLRISLASQRAELPWGKSAIPGTLRPQSPLGHVLQEGGGDYLEEFDVPHLPCLCPWDLSRQTCSWEGLRSLQALPFLRV